MNQDTYYIRISGKINVPELIKIAHNYRLLLEGSITSEAKHDAENGTNDYVSTFRPVMGTIEAETGKTIKLRDVRSRSSQVRGMIHKIWQQTDDPREQEKAYDDTMKYILSHLEELFEKGNVSP